MPSGDSRIPLCEVGGPSLVSADYANKLIIPLNAILQGKVAPIANVGKISYAGGQFIIDLSALDARLRKLELGSVLPPGGNANQVLAKNSNANYDFKWMDIPNSNANSNTECCNTLANIIANLSDDVNSLQTSVGTINNRLDNASIDAACANGNVTVELNI